MPREDWTGYLRRHVARLQLSIREDLRLVAWGITRAAGGDRLWLDCERVGARSGVPWRGWARLPRAGRGRGRRGLLLALAQALSDIACRSGTGVGLWREPRRAVSPPARASSPWDA